MKRRRLGQWVGRVFLAVGGSTLFGACNSDLALEFRGAASAGLQDGVQTIAASLIDGIFAVITPNTTSPNDRV